MLAELDHIIRSAPIVLVILLFPLIAFISVVVFAVMIWTPLVAVSAFTLALSDKCTVMLKRRGFKVK